MALSVQISVISLISLAFLCAQSSRLAFAVTRDRGLPFSDIFSKVEPNSHVPANAICLVAVINMALMSIYFGSVTGFNTILAISTESFCKRPQILIFNPLIDNFVDVSYIMPLAVRIWGRWSGKGTEFIEGPYNLKFGVWLNIIGLLYLALHASPLASPRPIPSMLVT
jgi:amino acid transporter